MVLLLDTALRFDFLFWAASQVAHDAFVRSILGTPPELVARAPAPEQARIQQVLDHILPVSPRRMGLLNDARVVSALPRYDLEKIAAPTLAISAADDLTARSPARATPQSTFRTPASSVIRAGATCWSAGTPIVCGDHRVSESGNPEVGDGSPAPEQEAEARSGERGAADSGDRGPPIARAMSWFSCARRSPFAVSA